MPSSTFFRFLAEDDQEFDCFDPALLYQQCLAQGMPTDFYGKANSYDCPIGPDTGVAWLLMCRRDLNLIDDTKAHSLMIWDDNSEAAIIKKLWIRRAVSVSYGEENDPDSLYLVKLVDRRFFLNNYSYPMLTEPGFNIRSPIAYDTDQSISDARREGFSFLKYLNSPDEVYTYETACERLWSFHGGLLPHDWPGLPYTPSGKPEGWYFAGKPMWVTLHQLLQKISCTTVYDPIDDDFIVVKLGTVQAGLAAALTNLSGRIQWSHNTLEGSVSRYPKYFYVYFQRQVEAGREDYLMPAMTLLLPHSNPWTLCSPYHLESVTTSSISANYSTLEGTYKVLWDDMPALMHPDFNWTSASINPTPTNLTDIQTRATELVENWLLTQEAQNIGYNLYRGCTIQISTGSQTHRVLWRDYGDGLFTEIHRYQTMGNQVAESMDILHTVPGWWTGSGSPDLLSRKFGGLEQDYPHRIKYPANIPTDCLIGRIAEGGQGSQGGLDTGSGLRIWGGEITTYGIASNQWRHNISGVGGSYPVLVTTQYPPNVEVYLNSRGGGLIGRLIGSLEVPNVLPTAAIIRKPLFVVNDIVHSLVYTLSSDVGSDLPVGGIITHDLGDGDTFTVRNLFNLHNAGKLSPGSVRRILPGTTVMLTFLPLSGFAGSHNATYGWVVTTCPTLLNYPDLPGDGNIVRYTGT